MQQRVAALEPRLGTNSTNSSVPPSANPLGTPKPVLPVLKKKSKRKPDGQPGPAPRLKHLLPTDRVQHTVACVPKQCSCYATPLPQEPALRDTEPMRFRTIELPPVVAVIMEYQGQAGTCPYCGEVTREPIPWEFLTHSVGPRLTVTLS